MQSGSLCPSPFQPGIDFVHSAPRGGAPRSAKDRNGWPSRPRCMSLESCRTKKRQRTAALQDLPTFIALRTSRSVLECGSPLPLWLACAGIVLCCFLASAALPANFASAFDIANRLYEEGKFTEAADAYAKLIQQGAISPTVYFNLGNA